MQRLGQSQWCKCIAGSVGNHNARAHPDADTNSSAETKTQAKAKTQTEAKAKTEAKVGSQAETEKVETSPLAVVKIADIKRRLASRRQFVSNCFYATVGFDLLCVAVAMRC